MVDTVTITNSTEGPSLEATAKAMGIDPASVDATQTAQSAPENAKILGKFNSPEDLAKAYQELEKKLGQKPTEEPEEDKLPSEVDEDAEPTEQPETTEEEPKTDEDKAKEELESRGLDFDEFTKEYEESEGLSDASYEKLEKAGISRDVVDQFIQGQEAVRELTRIAVFSEVGGEANYDAMIAWASDNYSAKEIELYDSAIDSRDNDARMAAVKALKARYEAANGREPSRTLDTTTRSRGDTAVYTSVAQMQKDINDPRYWSDPAFRARVEAKVGRSNIL